MSFEQSSTREMLVSSREVDVGHLKSRREKGKEKMISRSSETGQSEKGNRDCGPVEPRARIWKIDWFEEMNGQFVVRLNG